jgi:hypothetical protein
VTTFPRRDSVRGDRGLTPVFFLYRDGGDYRGAVSPNEYSRRWHETFSKGRDGSADVSFLALASARACPRRLLRLRPPQARARRARLGVVGVERDPNVAAAAGAFGLNPKTPHPMRRG